MDYKVTLTTTAQQTKSKLPSNKVTTTKYTILSFLPKCTFYQFARLANVYFLVTALVMLIPNISPIDPLTAILPLVLVISVAMLKEGIEDLVTPK